MIVKRFGCTTIHNKVLYKCLIHSFIHSHKPAIPTIVLAKVRSLDNKLDYIRLLRSTQRTVRDCCAFVFMETWLNNSVPDCAIQLDQLTCY